MINKNEFDLLLKEISQIENKIDELKVLNQFDKAKEFENILAEIREKAKTMIMEGNVFVNNNREDKNQKTLC